MYASDLNPLGKFYFSSCYSANHQQHVHNYIPITVTIYLEYETTTLAVRYISSEFSSLTTNLIIITLYQSSSTQLIYKA